MRQNSKYAPPTDQYDRYSRFKNHTAPMNEAYEEYSSLPGKFHAEIVFSSQQKAQYQKRAKTLGQW